MPRRRYVGPGGALAVLGWLACAPAAAGGSATILSPLREPAAVATDADGSIFVCEALAARVSVFDRGGVGLRRWGRFGRGDGELDEPRGIAVANGSVYVADTGNDRIEVFDTEGRLVRQWGRFGTDAGEFNEPLGVAVRGGRVFVADARNNRVQVFDTEGRFLFYVWSYGAQEGAFDRPVAVAVDETGSFYVSDQGNSRVEVFSPDGRFVRSWGGRGRGYGLLDEPGGLAAIGDRVVVADPFNRRVVTFDRTGELVGERTGPYAVSAVAGLSGGEALVACAGFEDRCAIVPAALDPSGAGDLRPAAAREGYGAAGSGVTLVVASRETGSLALVDLGGRHPRALGTIGRPGREPLELARPEGFIVDDPASTIVVSDGGNDRLQILRLRARRGASRRLDPLRARYVGGIDLGDPEMLDVEPGHWSLEPSGIGPGAMARDRRGSTILIDRAARRVLALDGAFRPAGVWGGYGELDGQFRRPIGLAIDRARGAAYVLDAGRRRVQAFDLDGRFRLAWGAPGEAPGEFLAPSGIAVGPDGSVLVLDRGSDRVDRFDGRGRFLGAWGGRGSDAGRLLKPEAIHVDGRGRVIVIDSGNRRAQAFDASGVFLWEIPLEFGRTPPGRAGARAASSRSAATPAPCGGTVRSNGGRYDVEFAAVPCPVPVGEPFTLEVRVRETRFPNVPAPRTVLDVDAIMPEHGHGLNVKPQVRAIGGPATQDRLPGHGALGDGRFQVPGMLFHMPGLWEIHFDVSHGAITERAQLEIELE